MEDSRLYSLLFQVLKKCFSNQPLSYSYDSCADQFLLNNSQISIMYSLQVYDGDYYGYHSKINQDGKRIRRLRRTQVSAQKLYYSRMRSPNIASTHRTPRQSKEFTQMRYSNARLTDKNSFKKSLPNSYLPQKESDFFERALAKQKQHDKQMNKMSSLQSKNEYELQNQSNYNNGTNRQKELLKVNSNVNIYPINSPLKQIKKMAQIQSQSEVERYSMQSSRTNSRKVRQKVYQSDFSKISAKDKVVQSPYLRSSFLQQINQLTKKSNGYNNQQDIQKQKLQSSVSSMSYSSSLNLSKASLKNMKQTEQPVYIKKGLISAQTILQTSQQNKNTQKLQITGNKVKDHPQKLRNQYMTKNTNETDESNYSNKNQKKTIFGKEKQQNSKIIKVVGEDNKKISKIRQDNITQKGNQSQMIQKIPSKVLLQMESGLLSSQKQSKLVAKKKSLGSYTLQDVLKNIQQHQCRLAYLYLFTQNTRNIYSTVIKYQRYEKLCFLMMKKYYTEKQRMIQCLKGQAYYNCLKLTDIQIPNEVLKLHLPRPQIKQKCEYYLQEDKQFYQQLKAQYNRLILKHPKDKFIKLQTSRDKYSKEIMRLLMEQLSKIYQQLQNQQIQYQYIDLNEKRVIQIIELMFLISQLSGRPVKKFTLAQENQSFTQYYEENYERIMETAQFFQKYS